MWALMWALATAGCALVALATLAVLLVRRLARRPQQSMRGEVVLLTGAGGGLGRQLALQLARRGCPLALVDVAERANAETASLARAAAPGLEVRAYAADLGERDDVAALLDRVLRDFGRIDVLISNAAILHGGGACDASDEQVDRMLAVNLRAAMLLVRGALPGMRARRRGRLVAVSSAAGIVPNHAMGLYGAAKAGLTHYMQCLYRELRTEGLEKDIVVTVIHPFFMSTFDLLVNASHITGWFQSLTPFMDPAWAARRAVASVARGEHYVVLPHHAKGAMLLMTLLPLCLLNFALEKCLFLTFKYIPPYEYRHTKRDIHMLHEFLLKGFEPFADPEELLQAMDDECTSQGQSPPYDFTVFKGSLEDYYKKRDKIVPGIVQKYINKERK